MSKPTPISPPKTPRTVSEIQNEYSSLCAKAGHLQYQIETLGKDLSLINAQLRDLNFEAAAAKNNEAAVALAQQQEAEKTAKAAVPAAGATTEAPKAKRTRKPKVVAAPPADDEVPQGEEENVQ